MYAMDLDDAKARTVEFGLTLSRSNIRRVVRAHDLLNRGYVRLQANFGENRIYQVQSQNALDQSYTVLRNGKVECTCPDYQKHKETCKHGLAVLLQEEIDRDEAWIAQQEAYEADRYACLHELY